MSTAQKSKSLIFGTLVAATGMPFIDALATRQDFVNRRNELDAEIEDLDAHLNPHFEELSEHGRVHNVFLNDNPTVLTLSKKRGVGGGQWQCSAEVFDRKSADSSTNSNQEQSKAAE